MQDQLQAQEQIARYQRTATLTDEECKKSQKECSQLRAECSNYKAEIRAHAERNVLAKQQTAALQIQVMVLQDRINELSEAQERQAASYPKV
jgi:hypothetical protein